MNQLATEVAEKVGGFRNSLHDNALSLTILFNITILIIATPNELHS
jgi:hypothetical protein